MIIQPQMAVAYEYYIQDNKDRQQNRPSPCRRAARLRQFYANSSILAFCNIPPLGIKVQDFSFVTYNPVNSNIMNPEPKPSKKTQETF